MIRFSAVTKDFGGAIPALNNVDFQVGKGEFIFLTGASGSGKSTLLKLITKEYIPTLGEVEFDSTPLSQIRGSKIHHHRRKIGVVFQDYRLLPELNVWENIALPLEILGRPKEEIEERVTDLLDLVQLSDKPYAFPTQLSGGESQRVGIARALATAPGVLLADEPTGNLDPQNTLLIAKLFHKIHELGTTILFATHDLAILNAISARRIHLEKGRIVSDAPHIAGKNPQEIASTDQQSLQKNDPQPKPASQKEIPAPVETITQQAIAPTPPAQPIQEIPSKMEIKEKEVTAEMKPESPAKLGAEDPKEKETKKGFQFPSFKLPFGKKKATLKPQEHEIPESKRTSQDPVDAKHVTLDDDSSLDLLDKHLQSIEDEMKDMLINVEDLDTKKKSVKKS